MSFIVSASQRIVARFAETALVFLPALRARPQNKAVDQAATAATAAPAASRPGAAPAGEVGGAGEVEVGAVVSATQLVRLVAEPPLLLEEGAAGPAWRSRAETEVTLVLGDGTEKRLSIPAGAAIRVLSGLVHFPPA